MILIRISITRLPTDPPRYRAVCHEDSCAWRYTYLHKADVKRHAIWHQMDHEGAKPPPQRRQPTRRPSQPLRRTEPVATAPPFEHGTLNGYNNHRCRCQPCRDAARAYQEIRKLRIAETTRNPMELPRLLLPASIADRAWIDDALCAQTDPELFFPDKGGSTREAKAVCRRCPVTNECLEEALATGDLYGIRGGLSDRERRALAKARRAGMDIAS